jgi:hypothetical protein
MSKEMKKNLRLKYEELSDAELELLSGGQAEEFFGNFGQGKQNFPGPDFVVKRKTTGSGK